MIDLNKLIGIPFKLNHKDFKFCDCRGIVYLYYKYVKNKELPFTDGKNIIFRNQKKDKNRMASVLNTFADIVDINDIDEGDIVVIDNHKQVGSLGVCINNKQILHMDGVVGSCLTRLRYLKEFISLIYRPND